MLNRKICFQLIPLFLLLSNPTLALAKIETEQDHDQIYLISESCEPLISAIESIRNWTESRTQTHVAESLPTHCDPRVSPILPLLRFRLNLKPFIPQEIEELLSHHEIPPTVRQQQSNCVGAAAWIVGLRTKNESITPNDADFLRQLSSKTHFLKDISFKNREKIEHLSCQKVRRARILEKAFRPGIHHEPGNMGIFGKISKKNKIIPFHAFVFISNNLIFEKIGCTEGYRFTDWKTSAETQNASEERYPLFEYKCSGH